MSPVMERNAMRRNSDEEFIRTRLSVLERAPETYQEACCRAGWY